MAQLALDLPHRPAIGADDFLVAACNEVAVAWLDRWPDWPGPALVLHGPEGSGKTHLARVWQRRAGAADLDPAALRRTEPAAALADRPGLVVDGAGAVAGDSAAERSLLHLINGAGGTGKHLLLIGRQAPAAWGVVLPDLASRLRAAPAAAVGEPDDALLGALLVKQFADRQIRIGGEVVAFLVPRIERSFAAVQRVVAALDAVSLAAGRAITVPLARAALEGERQ